MTIDLLNTKDLDKAIEYLQKFEEINKKKLIDIFEKLQEVGIQVAIAKYEEATYAGVKDVIISSSGVTENNGKIEFTISAEGNATLFIEFGTGIEMPKAQSEAYELVNGEIANHGEYGKRMGANPQGWWYKGEMPENPPLGTEPALKKDGSVIPGKIHTHGAPATSFMYESRKAIEQKIEEVVKEVYG